MFNILKAKYFSAYRTQDKTNLNNEKKCRFPKLVGVVHPKTNYEIARSIYKYAFFTTVHKNVENDMFFFD